MISYFFRRILEAIPVFFIIITAVFFMVRFVPGGPFDKERAVSPEIMKTLDRQYGLDKPLIVQYGIFLGNLARGDFGWSYKYNGWRVGEILREKAFVSMKLGAFALFIAALGGICAGFAAAKFDGTPMGTFLSCFSMMGICLPSFVLGPLLILVFSMKFGWFNSMGWDDFPSDIVLPSITLAMFYLAWIARLARSSAMDESVKQYVKTARAKGVCESKIYYVHILKNAIQPVAAYLGPAAAAMLTGSFVVETIFQIPGLGRFFISSALDSDYSMIMGCVVIYAFFIVAFNLVSDMLCAAINPRIRKGLK